LQSNGLGTALVQLQNDEKAP